MARVDPGVDDPDRRSAAVRIGARIHGPACDGADLLPRPVRREARVVRRGERRATRDAVRLGVDDAGQRGVARGYGGEAARAVNGDHVDTRERAAEQRVARQQHRALEGAVELDEERRSRLLRRLRLRGARGACPDQQRQDQGCRGDSSDSVHELRSVGKAGATRPPPAADGRLSRCRHRSDSCPRTSTSFERRRSEAFEP